MRKFKALIAVLTAAVLVFSLVGTAFAASAPSDVQGTKYEAAATKLMAYGISSGWGGGQFNPTAAVTRAQFSVLVVNELGLKAAAQALQGTDTQFKDVKGSYWASGAIQVATNKGIISGYGDGTFRPDQPITYMEAAILTVRALGYREADPNAHFIKAIELGLMANVDGKANETAIRGNLAIILDNMLTKEIGQLDKDGVWQSTKATPASKLQLQTVTGKVYAYDSVNKKVDLDGIGVGVDYALADNYYLVGAPDLSSAVGLQVKATLQGPADSQKVVYLEVTTAVASKKTGEIASVDSANGKLTLKGDTATYSFAASFEIVRNGVSQGTDLGKLRTGDSVTLSLDKEGKIIHVVASAFDVKEKQVTAVDTAAKTITAGGTSYNLSAAKIVRNGAAATLSDIKKDDIVYLALTAPGATTVSYAEAYYNKVTGIVSAIKTTAAGRVVTVNGKDYKKSAQPVAADAFDTIQVGYEVEFLLNKDGDVTVVNKADFPVRAGMVLGYSNVSGTQSITVDIRGTATEFKLASGVSADASVIGKVYQLSLDASGNVRSLTAVNYNTVSTYTKIESKWDNAKTIVVGGNSYVVTDQSIIYKNGAYATYTSLAVGDQIKLTADANGNVQYALVNTCVVDPSKVTTSHTGIVGAAGAVEKGAKVDVYDNAGVTSGNVGTQVTAGNDGSFAFTFTPEQASGTILWVKVTDADGAVNVFTVTVP